MHVGRIEYRCNGGKNDKKMCEESNEDHHVCEWCKLQIAMDNFTITRRPKVSSSLPADQTDKA